MSFSFLTGKGYESFVAGVENLSTSNLEFQVNFLTFTALFVKNKIKMVLVVVPLLSRNTWNFTEYSIFKKENKIT